MRWRKLTTWPEDVLWRGTVFRLLQSDWQHESPVDLMLMESADSLSGFSLVVTTGYKAGARAFSLPASARAKGKVSAVSRTWLIRYWEKKVYAACPVSAVRVVANYPPGVRLAGDARAPGHRRRSARRADVLPSDGFAEAT